MISASQLRAARALLGIDQLALAQRAKLSLPTIQRIAPCTLGYTKSVLGLALFAGRPFFMRADNCVATPTYVPLPEYCYVDTSVGQRRLPVVARPWCTATLHSFWEAVGHILF
jgi:hypothetical protein